MASTELALVVTAKDQASKILDDVDKKAGGLGKTLGDVGKIAGGFVVGVGIQKLGGFLIDATKAAAEDAASVSRLDKALENALISSNKFSESQLPGALRDTKDTVNEVIDANQRLGFSDDQTRDSLAILAAQTGSVSEAFDRNKLAMDLARGANIDVVTASKLLGKVTDENVNVLARYGIKVKEGAGETELFGAIQEKFGGQAQAFADTTAGKMEQLKIRMGELKESIGSALLPIMTALTDFMVTKALPWMEKIVAQYGPQLQAFATDVAKVFQNDLWPAFRTGIETVAPGFEAFVNFVLDHKEILIAAFVSIGVAIVVSLGPISLALLAITGLITVGGLLVENWDWIAAQATIWWGDIKSTIAGVVNNSIQNINALIDAANRIPFVNIAKIEEIGQAAIQQAQIAARLRQLGETEYPDIPSHAAGTPYVPRTGLALLHQGEAVIPASMNRGGWGGAGMPNVTVNVYGSIRSDREITAIIRDALMGGGFRGLVSA